MQQIQSNKGNNSNNLLLQHISDGYIMIKCNYKLIKIKIDDIFFISSLCDYVVIKMVTGEKYIILSTTKDMVDNLPTDKFIRIHRSFIVNMDKIHTKKGNSLILVYENIQHTLPIGRIYNKGLKAKLNARI